MVNSVSGNSQSLSASSSAPTATGAAGAANSGTQIPQLGENDFLQLLCTQLQYQDPLQPTDNTEFIAQLAQFSSLEGINNLGTTMQSVLNGITSLQSYTAASFVGKSATVNGNSFAFSGSPITLGYSLPANAADVSVSIENSAGQVIDTVDLGPSNSGKYQMAWNGTDSSGANVQPGQYTFAVNAVDSSKKPITASTSITGPITSVNFNNGTTNLMVGGVSVPMSGITSIY